VVSRARESRHRCGGRRLASALTASVAAVIGIGTLAGAVPAPHATEAGGSWTTYGGSVTRASFQTNAPRLLPIRSRWRSSILDGAVYGEPLIAAGLVYVATERDTVYALNASTGKIVWRRSLGTPTPATALPCGDIEPTVGVTSTMVIDPATDRLFASASTFAHGAVEHLLVALDPASGAIVFRRDLDQHGWSAAAQLQRTGLGLSAGRVLVGFGGNEGDCGAYNGYLMGIPTSGQGATLVFKVPTQREGAIWAPSGVAVNTAGDTYLATGNGSSNTTRDRGDSVIELDPSLREIGYFTPTDWLQDNANDLDLGSSSPVLLPGNRVLQVGKEQTGYLLSGAHLGGVGGQLASATICFALGGDAVRGSTVYVGCPSTALTAVSLTGNSLRVRWRAPSGVTGSPTIAGGAVWSIGSGTLYGLSFATGKVIASIPTIPVEHFAAPSAGEGLLVVGGASQVQAFEGPAGYRP
jgi:outer membrane protein assembly factor BamB